MVYCVNSPYALSSSSNVHSSFVICEICSYTYRVIRLYQPWIYVPAYEYAYVSNTKKVSYVKGKHFWKGKRYLATPFFDVLVFCKYWWMQIIRCYFVLLFKLISSLLSNFENVICSMFMDMIIHLSILLKTFQEFFLFHRICRLDYNKNDTFICLTADIIDAWCQICVICDCTCEQFRVWYFRRISIFHFLFVVVFSCHRSEIIPS